MIARFGEQNGHGRTTNSAAERAYRHVHVRLGWEYLPGARLPIREIALAVRASRQPVRDAMQRLAAEGVITIVAQVGCLVARPEPQEIRDLARLVATADGTFVPEAAQRATPADLERLAACVVAGERAAAAEWHGLDEPAAAWLASRDFFGEAYRIVAPPALADAVAAMRTRVEALTTLRFFDHRRDLAASAVRTEARLAAQEAARLHRALLTAFAGGDSERAGRIAAEYATRVAARADDIASAE